MTKEEAIEYLEKLFMMADITDAYGDMDDTEPYETALNMAIEALSAETKGDLISREQAIAIATQEGAYDYISAQELAELPSAEPAQRTGKWILCDNQRQEDINNGNYMFFCLNCLKADLHAKTQEVPYCWWCGARMVGDEE